MARSAVIISVLVYPIYTNMLKPFDSCDRFMIILSLAFLIRMLLDNLFTFREKRVQRESILNSILTVLSLGRRDSECLSIKLWTSDKAMMKARSSSDGMEAWRE